MVTEPTRNNSIIDKFFISKFCPCKCEIGPPLSTSDHNSVFTVINMPVTAPSLGSNFVYDLRQRHVSNFVNSIRSFDWSSFIDSNANVNDKCSIFQDFLEDCFHIYIYINI